MAKKVYQEGHISPAEAISELQKGGLLQDVRYPDQALRRLLSTGAIVGIPPHEKTPKEGWEVDAESLSDYIRIQKLTPDELRQELLGVKTLKSEVEQLRAALEEMTAERNKFEKQADRLRKKYEPEKKAAKPRKPKAAEVVTEVVPSSESGVQAALAPSEYEMGEKYLALIGDTTKAFTYFGEEKGNPGMLMIEWEDGENEVAAKTELDKWVNDAAAAAK